jgi:hypothetical protein
MCQGKKNMRSDLRNKGQQSFLKDNKVYTEPPTVPDDSSWMETTEDDVTVGSKQWMSHQERQALVKNRTYAATKPNESSQQLPQ